MAEYIVSKKASFIEVVRALESNPKQVVVVLSPTGKLEGTITDGDIRRHLLLLKHTNVEAVSFMNKHPTTASLGTAPEKLKSLMLKHNINVVPIVDKDGRFLELVHIKEISRADSLSRGPSFRSALIMAGGEGRRLRPLTEKIPKPMVEINGKPILQSLISDLKRCGTEKIFISLNYLADVIQDYFGDGSNFGVEIVYLKETSKLGTGGSLGLLPEKLDSDLLVLNADVITSLDFRDLYTFHIDSQAVVTLSAISHSISVPFGVIQNDGIYVSSIKEKPVINLNCNAAVYALSPSVLSELPAGAFDMTDLIEELLLKNKKVAMFPLHEYWADIGTIEQLEEARKKDVNTK